MVTDVTVYVEAWENNKLLAECTEETSFEELSTHITEMMPHMENHSISIWF